MSDITSLRAEIKAWERKFKETNGREATIDDIKKQPSVAQKYKLYKKLSKAAATSLASSSTSRPDGPPSTPIRPTSYQSSKSLLSGSRTIESTAPLASFNPFSPQKHKGKKKDGGISLPISNPFASPRKPNSQDSQRQLSPGPFPLIEPPQPSTSGQLLQEHPSAVSRARKRLRGEPVSPSPNKDKRRRVLSQTTLPFPKLQLRSTANGGSDSGGDDGDDDAGIDGPNSSFVDDSPMKPTVNGKRFTLLFEETVQSTPMADLFGGDALAPKSRPSGNGHSQRDTLPSMDEEMFGATNKKFSTKNASSSSLGSHSSVLKRSQSNFVQATSAMPARASDGPRNKAPIDRSISAKRVLSETARGDDGTDSAEDSSSAALQLLPPSPDLNAPRTSGRSEPSGARRLKNTGRKKAKLRGDSATEDMNDDDENSSDSFDTRQNVKLVHHSRGIRAVAPTEEGNSEIEDVLLNYARHVQPRGKATTKQVGNGPFDHDPAEEGADGDGVDEEVKLEGALPDELHRVLVLASMKSKRNEIEEERIVKGLLSGRRIMHYDSRTGAEIWGVGEDDKDEFAEDAEAVVGEEEDEWEGEPVPWEIGELSESHYHLEEL